MKKIISILIVIYCVVNIHAGAQDSIKTTEPQQVVGGGEATRPNADDYLYYKPYEDARQHVSDTMSTMYILNIARNAHIPNSQYLSCSRSNAVLVDKSLPAKIFREVFTLNELMFLRSKGILKGSVSASVTFNPQGKIIYIHFVVFHQADPQIKQILTPERLKTLFIKLRDRVRYSMPEPNSSFSDYYVIFDVKFSDVLLGKPVMQYVPGED